MQALRLAAVEGLTRLAHGGVEVGGVLFGVREQETVRILAHRPLICEYAFGPSFTLSDKDGRALEEVLAAPATDAELWEMDVVGWYHSHTRSGIQLSAKDLQIFERYFPQPWQIALVLRPHLFDPTRGGFFFRQPDGSIHAESALREFIVQPAGAAGPPPPPRDETPVRPEPAAETPSMPVTLVTQPYRSDASTAVVAPAGEPKPIVVTVGAGSPGRQSLAYWRWGTAIFALAFVAGFIWTGREPPGLSLRALDHDGQLRIDWNCNARVVRQSEGGSLEIDDGTRKVVNELSPEQLQAGSVTYIRTTDNVVVNLRVRVPQQGTLSETTRFLAMPGDMHAVARVNPPQPSGEGDRTEAPAPAPVLDEHRQTVRQLEERLNQMAEKLRVAAEAPKTLPPVSPPERRALVVPAASAPRSADSLPPPPAATTAPLTTALAPGIAPVIAPVIAPSVPRLPAPAAPKAAYQGPATGRIVWTGKLARRGTLEILAGHASTGYITGALPGVPVRVQVLPAELTPAGLRVFTADPNSVNVTEAPGAQNGWNRTVYVYSPRQAGEVVVAEAPGTQNGWSRIILRAERGDHSIILLRWELVSGVPAAHGAGDR